MKRVARKTENKLVVVIPMIVRFGIVVIKVQLAVIITIHVEHVRIAIGVRKCAKYHPYHRPSNTLKAVSNLE